MKQFKVWQAPLYAFFSTQFYRDLGTNGKGVGFLYLLCLLLVACGVDSLKNGLTLAEGINSVAPYYAEQVPKMTIHDGQLSIDKESIYYIQDPQTQETIAAFDTTRSASKTSQYGVKVLVTDRHVYLSKGDGSDWEVWHFSGIKDLQVDGQSLLSFTRPLTFLLPLVDLLFRLPLNWIKHIIIALIYSVGGLILAKMISVPIKYEGILRIASFADGNVLILTFLAQFIPSEINGVELSSLAVHFGLVQLLLASGYTLFGVSANLSPPTFEPAERPDFREKP